MDFPLTSERGFAAGVSQVLPFSASEGLRCVRRTNRRIEVSWLVVQLLTRWDRTKEDLTKFKEEWSVSSIVNVWRVEQDKCCTDPEESEAMLGQLISEGI